MSAGKIDHKAAANGSMEHAQFNSWEPSDYLAEAQVSATLYAAEQTHLANLITYWAAMTEEKLAYLNEQDKTRFRAIQELIEEGLGLA